MLDEPGLSRQWVARRLQRALSVERWCGPLRAGLANGGRGNAAMLARHGDSAARRAARLESLIRSVGSEPYGSWGLGGRAARVTARMLARLSARGAARLAGLIARHTLSEYESLVAFVDGSPGLDRSVVAAIEPMYEESRREFDELGSFECADQ